MNMVADLSPAVRRLAGAWLLLAVSALGLSALFAVVLVLARTPFIGLGSGAFRTALVLHVDMAVVVWFLSAAAGVWTLTAGQAGRLAWAGFGAAVLGAAVVVASPFVGSPPPILANYVPVLDSTVFFFGLGCYLVGVVLAGLVALGFAARRREAAWQQAVLWSIAIALLAAALLVWVEATAPEARAGIPIEPAGDGGAGHLEPLDDGAARQAVGRREHDARPLGQPLRRGPRAHPALQRGAVSGPQREYTNGQWHAHEDTIKCAIMHVTSASYH